MDEYQKAYLRVRDRLTSAKQVQEKFQGPCLACKYLGSDGDLMADFREYFCHHPLVISPEFNKKQGRIVAKPYSLGLLKRRGLGDDYPDLCGPNRSLFEQSLFWPVVKLGAALIFLALSAWIWLP